MTRHAKLPWPTKTGQTSHDFHQITTATLTISCLWATSTRCSGHKAEQFSVSEMWGQVLGSLGRVVSSSSSMFYCSNVSNGIFPKFSFNSGLEFGISSDHAVNMSNNTTQGHGHDTSNICMIQQVLFAPAGAYHPFLSSIISKNPITIHPNHPLTKYLEGSWFLCQIYIWGPAQHPSKSLNRKYCNWKAF